VVDLPTSGVLSVSVNVFSAMAQKWYLEIRKLAEKVRRTKETRLLNYAGEILLTLSLILASFVSYWLVWTLNGLGGVPRTAAQHKTKAKGELGEGNKAKSTRLT
jgi:hypothetical protein